MRTLTATDLAKLCDVTRQTVSRWVAAGCPAQRFGKRRRFDADEVRSWLEENGRTCKPGRAPLAAKLTRRRRRNGSTPPVVTAEDLAAARLRKELALAEKHEIQIARLKGELLDADDVRRDRLRRIGVVKSRLLQLPMTVAPLCSGRDEEEIEAIVTEEVCQLLEDFARGERDNSE